MFVHSDNIESLSNNHPDSFLTIANLLQPGKIHTPECFRFTKI